MLYGGGIMIPEETIIEYYAKVTPTIATYSGLVSETKPVRWIWFIPWLIVIVAIIFIAKTIYNFIKEKRKKVKK